MTTDTKKKPGTRAVMGFAEIEIVAPDVSKVSSDANHSLDERLKVSVEQTLADPYVINSLPY
jgi:hypothetical protein